MKKTLGLLLFVLFASFTFVACNGATTAAPTTAAPTTAAPTTAAPTTLPPTTVPTTAGPTTFSPAVESYLAYAASDWGVQYWKPGDAANSAGVVAVTDQVNGYGTYTVSLDFTGVDGGKGNGFAFLDVEIADGELHLPNSYMTIDEILINGVAVEDLGSTYTSSDNGIATRTNLYNSWVSGIVEGRTEDGRYFDISATPLDISGYTDVTSIEVTYTINPGVEIAARAYLQFADTDWGDAQAWYDGNSETNVLVDEYGTYTVSLDFTGTANGYANGVAFFDVEIANGEIFFPKNAMTIDSVVINGVELTTIGKTYTTSDNENDTRVNLFNDWVSKIETGRTADGDIEEISAKPLDLSAYPQIQTIAVTFTLGDGLYLGEVEPVPLPAEGTSAYLAVSDSAWSVGYWGVGNSGNTANIVAVIPEIDGYGQYTTSLDFTGTTPALLADITFLGLEITGGEQYFPYCRVIIDSVSINGVLVTELGGTYTSTDNGTETRVNLYNTWVSEITDARLAAGVLIEDVSATPLDGTAYTDITSISVTFTIVEGAFEYQVNDEFEGYELPDSFNAFMMFSDTSGAWESYAAGTSGDCSVIGDGVYEVSLNATDIGATGAAVAGQVFLIDIEGLGKAMRFLETMDDENNTDLVVEVRVFVDGTEVTVNNSNILVGDIEGNDRLRLELYNTWGTGTADLPVVAPELLTPANEIVVWFKLVGTGMNTGASTDWPSV